MSGHYTHFPRGLTKNFLEKVEDILDPAGKYRRQAAQSEMKEEDMKRGIAKIDSRLEGYVNQVILVNIIRRTYPKEENHEPLTVMRDPGPTPTIELIREAGVLLSEKVRPYRLTKKAAMRDGIERYTCGKIEVMPRVILKQMYSNETPISSLVIPAKENINLPKDIVRSLGSFISTNCSIDIILGQKDVRDYIREEYEDVGNKVYTRMREILKF